MLIDEIDGFDQKMLDLISSIDKGEYSLAAQGPSGDGYEKTILKLHLHDAENCGVFNAFIYYGTLRIQIAFLYDPKPDAYKDVKELINQAITKKQLRKYKNLFDRLQPRPY